MKIVTETQKEEEKKNEDCNWDSTGRREPFKRVLEII